MLDALLYDRVLAFVQGDTHLRDLQRWVTPRIEVYFRVDDAEAIQLVSDIELMGAHMGSGIVTEQEARNYLRDRLTPSLLTFGSIRDTVRLRCSTPTREYDAPAIGSDSGSKVEPVPASEGLATRDWEVGPQ
jgi:hypothetical protein